MVERYDFTLIDASQPVDRIFRELQRQIRRLQLLRVRPRKRAAPKAKATA
jgi:hypothetical protein